MGNNSITIITTIISLFISLGFAIGIAIYQWRKAKKSDKEIIDLKRIMTSYKYLKELAFTHYENGKFDESLDVFKKYLLNNKDDKEWNEIIGNIFKKETEKLFSGKLIFSNSFTPGYSMIIQTFISNEDEFSKSTAYPLLIKTLINDYVNTFNRNRHFPELMIALFDREWKKATKFISAMKINHDQRIDTAFKEYVTNYLNIKMGIKNEIDDDVPF